MHEGPVLWETYVRELEHASHIPDCHSDGKQRQERKVDLLTPNPSGFNSNGRAMWPLRPGLLLCTC